MLVDGNSVHRSAGVLKSLRDRHPNLTVCFSTANTTDNCCQPLDLARNGLLNSALKVECARSMAQGVLQLSAEEVPEQPNNFKTDTTLRRIKGRMCEWFSHEWFSHAMQNLKHRLDLHEKAWRHLRVKKHEADMVYDEVRLRHSELFGEADTSAHTAVEPTTNDECIDDFAPPAQNFYEDSEATEEPPPQTSSSACPEGVGATERKGIDVHAVAGRRSAWELE